MASSIVESRDPRDRFAKPPFPQKKQIGSGSARELDPPADYGEASCTGRGRLEGRAALITGADSGIGRAVALCFAKEGADILFAFLEGDADKKKDAEVTVSLIEATGRKVVAYPGDIRRKPSVKRLSNEQSTNLAAWTSWLIMPHSRGPMRNSRRFQRKSLTELTARSCTGLVSSLRLHFPR